MRWRSPQAGDTRTKKVFLWFAKSLHGETRWLEWAVIKQIYVSGEPPFSSRWDSISWVDDDE